MVGRLAGWTRFLLVIAVLGLLVASAGLILVGAVQLVVLLLNEFIPTILFQGPHVEKELMVRVIDLVDMFLVAVVVYLAALGVYQLFVDPTVKLPRWLQMRNLNDLKHLLVGSVIVILGVNFVGDAVTTENRLDLLFEGAATALVIAALSLFYGVRLVRPGGQPESTDPSRGLSDT